jgi:hypothetical protein
MAPDLVAPEKARSGDKVAVLSPSFAAPGAAPAVHKQAMRRTGCQETVRTPGQSRAAPLERRRIHSRWWFQSIPDPQVGWPEDHSRPPLQDRAGSGTLLTPRGTAAARLRSGRCAPALLDALLRCLVDALLRCPANRRRERRDGRVFVRPLRAPMLRSGIARRGCQPRPRRAAVGRGSRSAAWCRRPRARAGTGPEGSVHGQPGRWQPNAAAGAR